MQGFARQFLDETIEILRVVPADAIERSAATLRRTRDRGGRLFTCGSGGGAGHASHAAADFRTLAGFEAYCVSDNVSELTARINDAGWEGAYAATLRASSLRADDCLLVFSVGGGDEERSLSVNLIRAMELAKERGASVVGVAGRDGGALARLADACVVIPTIDPEHVTAQTEGLQALMWHLLVSHPLLAARTPTWESGVPAS
ncbi:MAG: D-sedoheptulose 7-phosphate isomerase [Actinomycetota bacterium]|jgi:D-sedoheptulose 7-phosphate isomerase|nr:D-sedoheptulose 7-phosphate isomerase [Actinomycetota bacterium]